LGRRDHADVGSDYTIFVNPSITEVLCTTSAEAIAMGKWVILPKHASNEFFLPFPNCLQYTTKTEFVQYLQYALVSTPPLRQNENDNDNVYSVLTWQAATDRLIQTASLSKREKRRCERLQRSNYEKSIQEWHYALGTGRAGDVLRKVLGGGPVAEQSQYTSYNCSTSTVTTSLSEHPPILQPPPPPPPTNQTNVAVAV
jgi:digalactosyldiacylglycerol synthase